MGEVGRERRARYISKYEERKTRRRDKERSTEVGKGKLPKGRGADCSRLRVDRSTGGSIVERQWRSVAEG